MIKMPDGKLFIGGEWETGTGEEIVSIFPADGSINCSLYGASKNDVLRAVKLAKSAQSQSSWRSLKPHERARYLYAIADGIEANIDRISQIQTRDTGKTLRETAILASSASGTFRYFGALLESSDDLLTAQRNDSLTMSVYEPLGLVSAITPWNSPIASDAQKIAPALAAGNAVLLKPSSWSPLVSLELAKLVESSGLPKGLFSVLPGSGEKVGNLLVEHPDISKVTFTGSTKTGRSLAIKAAKKLMPISLELGGNAPFVVFADADISNAVEGFIAAKFRNAGQTCISANRLFVEEKIFDKFLKKLIVRIKNLKVGNGFEKNDVGPLISEKAIKKIKNHIDDALSKGGEILIGGKKSKIGKLFFEPTIVTNINKSMKIFSNENFGPIIPVIKFKSDDELIQLANDTNYGLAAYFYTKKASRVWKIIENLEYGMLGINSGKISSYLNPFGGLKESGVGREGSIQCLEPFLETKFVSWSYDD